MSALISIITPIYNGEPYINSYFESLSRLQHSSLEVIIIDDGSVDRSLELIQLKITSLTFPVRVLEQENMGPGSARNAGIKVACGEYVCFVDIDDLLDPLYITRQLEAFSDNIEFVICGFKVLYEKCESAVSESLVLPGSAWRAESPPALRALFCELFFKGVLNSPCNKLFRMSFLKYNKIHFDERLRLAEDTNFIIDCFYCAHGVNVINEALYWIRRTPRESATTRYNSNIGEIYTLFVSRLTKLYDGFLNCESNKRFMGAAILDWLWTLSDELIKKKCPFTFSEKVTLLKTYFNEPAVLESFCYLKRRRGLLGFVKWLPLVFRSSVLMLWMSYIIRILYATKRKLL